MRLLVLLGSIAMPVVAYLSQRGVFGPDNGAVSDQYPTLVVAAGYAFAIWGVIFLFDVLYGLWQATGERRGDPTLGRIAPWTAAGFLLTTAWMPLFSMGLYGVCLLVIFAALACLLRAASDNHPAWSEIGVHAHSHCCGSRLASSVSTIAARSRHASAAKITSRQTP